MRHVRTSTALLALALLVSGCARVSTLTTIRADGSFTRKVVFDVPKNGGVGAAVTAADAASKDKPPAATSNKPEDYFKVPVSSGEVRVVRSEDDFSVFVTLTRGVKTGSKPLQDITLTNDKGGPLATSSVTVTALPDGRLEYVESLHWVGPATSRDKMLAPEFRLKVKKLIPAEFQKTEVIDAVTQGLAVNAVRAFLGPPEPLLSDFLFNKDGALRRANARMYPANVAVMKTHIPSLTDAQAQGMARALAEDYKNEPRGPQSVYEGSTSTSTSNRNEMTPLYFEVSFPGKVVETNGILDPIDGHVYWSLLALGLQLEDVRLRVVVEP